MKYAALCDAPLNNRFIFVEANSHNEALTKMRLHISVICNCDLNGVILNDCVNELERPELVLYFETDHDRFQGAKDLIPCYWEANPLILFNDIERELALERFFDAMQSRNNFTSKYLFAEGSK